MNREQTLTLLSRHKDEMQRRFGVRRLALFGSRARDDSRSDSDTDLLVEFDGLATSARYFGLQFYLEDLLGSPVDLVTDRALRAELRPHVERDAVNV
jgi:predicted nucleotidyltransferase